MSIVGESERVQGDLYESDFKFAIDGMRFVDEGNQETTVENIHYAVVSNFDKGFMITSLLACSAVASATTCSRLCALMV